MQKKIISRTNVTPGLKKEIIRIVDDRIREAHVTKEDFTELKGIVREIAEAQNRTESRVGELAEAQNRTESRVGELAEAQKRTESRVGELAEAQNRTESRVQELTESQNRIESTMERGFKQLKDSISALGSRWGIMAESTFRNAITALLQDTGHTVTKGMYGGREVDIVIKNGGHIMLEITSSMKKSDIEKYVASAEDYQSRTGTNPRIMVAAIYIPPTVMREIVDAPRKIEIFSIEE